MTVKGDGARAVVLVVDDGIEVPIWQGEAPPRTDFSVVDALARLQLEARRHGWSIRLRNPCPQLLELLELGGLAGLFLEVGGEPKGGEQLGVEEVVQPGDPAV